MGELCMESEERGFLFLHGCICLTRQPVSRAAKRAGSLCRYCGGLCSAWVVGQSGDTNSSAVQNPACFPAALHCTECNRAMTEHDLPYRFLQQQEMDVKAFHSYWPTIAHHAGFSEAAGQRCHAMGLAAVPGHSCWSEVGAQSCKTAELSLGNEPSFCLDSTSNAMVHCTSKAAGVFAESNTRKERSCRKWNLVLRHPLATLFTLMKLHF